MHSNSHCIHAASVFSLIDPLPLPPFPFYPRSLSGAQSHRSKSEMHRGGRGASKHTKSRASFKMCTHNSTGAHQENHRGTKSALFRFLSTTIFFVSLFQCSFFGYRAEYYLKRASKYHRSRRRRSSIFFWQ